MIEVRNLSKTMPDGPVILKNIHLQIKKGEFVALLGSSGSGKSMLLRCMQLREKWDEGKLFYDDHDIFDMEWRGKLLLRKEWAFIEEPPVLNRNRNALKNVLAGSRKNRPWLRMITGTVSEEEHMDAMEYLHQVGSVMHKAKQPVGTLSGGELQRVAIARALAQKPQVILADGPTSNLDPQTAEDIMQVIRNICNRQRMTMVCALTHAELAEKYATRIIGLHEGEVAFDVSGRKLMLKEKRMIE